MRLFVNRAILCTGPFTGKLKRVLTHFWWAPTYYLMRLAIRWYPKHPFHNCPDIYAWARNSTKLNKQWNATMWFIIAIEIVLLYRLKHIV